MFPEACGAKKGLACDISSYRQRVRDCVSRLPGSKPVAYKACAGVRQNAYTKLADVGIDHLRLSASRHVQNAFVLAGVLRCCVGLDDVEPSMHIRRWILRSGVCVRNSGHGALQCWPRHVLQVLQRPWARDDARRMYMSAIEKVL
jgi:hypothetical protein